MELTLSRKSLGKSIVLAWVIFTIVWQLVLLCYFPLEGSNLIRLIIMTTKPLFLSAMIFAGYSWPRITIGILGPIVAFFIFINGAMSLDEEGAGAFISMGGAIIYAGLSLAVMMSKSVGRTGR